MRFKLKKIISILSIMLMVTSTCVTYAEDVRQIEDSSYNQYTRALDLQDNTFSGLSIMEEDIKKYDLFVIGDVPGTATNMNLEFYLTKYLNQREKLHYIIMDIGYAQSRKINMYLENANENLLDEVMEDMYPQYRTEETKKFFQAILVYNKKAELKLEIIGVGKDRKENALEEIEKLLGEATKIDGQVKEDFDLAKEIPSTKIFKEWKRKINEPESIYGQILEGEAWWEMQFLLNSVLEDTQELKNISNLELFVSLKRNEKLLYLTHSDQALGQEIYKTTEQKETSIKMQLEEKIPNYSNHIMTIAFYYDKGDTINWDKIEKQPITQLKDVTLVSEKLLAPYTLIKRPGNKSSILKSSEYSIIIKDSHMAMPYKYNEEAAKKEIANKKVGIDTSDLSFKGLESLDKVLNNHEIFFAGENHGNAGSYEMQLYLSKYFHQKAGAKFILIECCFAVGERINEYVQTGDDIILKEIMESLKGSLLYTDSFYNLIKGLRSYNTTLSQNNKIRVVGIDIVRKTDVAQQIIDEIIKDKDLPEIQSIREKTYDKTRDQYKAMQDVLHKDYDKYVRVLGKENMFRLEMLCLSLSADMQKYMEPFLVRERVLIDMFNTIRKYYPKDKLFAQMGAFHAAQENISEAEDGYSCAEYLQKYQKDTKGKVVSILYAYNESDRYSTSGQEMPVVSQYPEILKSTSKKEFEIIDLYSKTSPLAYMYVKANDNYITDTFQYMITINKAKAAKAYNLIKLK